MSVSEVEALKERQYEKLKLDSMGLNTTDEKVLDNVRTNILRPLPQVRPHPVNNQRVCIVGGGWSLNETEDELVKLYFEGAKIVTVNGSAKWCLERNIKPSAHVVMDARSSNLKFVQLPEVPGLKYFIASQCDPSLFDEVKDKEVHILHVLSTDSDEERKILDDYYAGNWMPVAGTNCVGFRALVLMRILGFQYFDLFGIDSCYKDDQHHAYSQPENDGEVTQEFNCAGRKFIASGWQVAQAHNFRNLVLQNSELFHLNIHGDGLIAHMLKSAAELKGK